MKRIQLELANKRKQRHIFTFDPVRVNPETIRVTVLDPGYKLTDSEKNIAEIPLPTTETRNIVIAPASFATKRDSYRVTLSGSMTVAA